MVVVVRCSSDLCNEVEDARGWFSLQWLSPPKRRKAKSKAKQRRPSSGIVSVSTVSVVTRRSPIEFGDQIS